MTDIDPVWRAFYRGKDAIRGDRNPYREGTPEWHAWRHGFASEHGERAPMSPEEVAAAFATLNKPAS
jgi:hypothetical protein